MKKLSDYKKEIAKATSKDELHAISYEAFSSDESEISNNKSLSNKIDTLCVIRELELKGYTKAQIKSMMK
jgi:hypothetical protein